MQLQKIMLFFFKWRVSLMLTLLNSRAAWCSW